MCFAGVQCQSAQKEARDAQERRCYVASAPSSFRHADMRYIHMMMILCRDRYMRAHRGVAISSRLILFRSGAAVGRRSLFFPSGHAQTSFVVTVRYVQSMRKGGESGRR